MKAYIIENFNGIDGIKQADIPHPEPKDNEVVIDLAYSSVNPVDWKISEGILKDRLPHHFPVTLGWDGSGKIAAVGSNVKSFQVGDPVFAYCRKDAVHDGTFAQSIAVDASSVSPIPKNTNFAEAAAIPLTGLTAWQALFDFAGLKKGQTILILAGAGGVGSMAIQFAKHVGARVLTTASAAKHDYVQKLGADAIIDYQTQNVVEEVHKICPEGVDVIFDCAGGTAHDEAWPAIKENGCFVSIVKKPDPQIAESRHAKSGYVFVRPDGKQLREIARLIEEGTVALPAIQEMPLEQVKEALKKNREGRTKGKIVLKIPAL